MEYFAWTTVLIGIFLVVLKVRNLLLARASREWPRAEGKVVKLEWRKNVWNGKNRNHWFAEIAYEYEVNGVTIRSERVAFGQTEFGSTTEDAEHVRRHYPLGSTVNVAYDPRHPRRSVLEPGNSYQIRTVLFAIVIFFFFLCWALFSIPSSG